MNIKHGGIKDANFLDFSISINPLKPKFINKNFYYNLSKLDKKYNYVEWIEEDFRKYFGKNSTITAGATEAFHIIGNYILKDYEILIPVPNYIEYFKISKFNNNNIHKINYFVNDTLRIDLLIDKIKKIRKKSKKKIAIIIGNPNNPTGIYIDLFDFMKEMYHLDILLIIDEAFIHFIPNNLYIKNTIYINNLFNKKNIKIKNNYDNINNENIIIIHTFTKFLGLPGIRVGYVLSNFYKKIFENNRLSWGIGSAGYLLIDEIIKNISYLNYFRKKTIKFIEKEKNKFKDFIKTNSYTNYFILKVNNKKELLDIFLKNKIYVRDLSNLYLKDYIRVGLKEEKDNNILLGLIEKYFNYFI